MAKRPKSQAPATPPPAVQRPPLGKVPAFIELEREVEDEFRPRMREALQANVNAVAESVSQHAPMCSLCGQSMKRHDGDTIHWRARAGEISARVERYRCSSGKQRCRPLLDLLGVEPGRISGSLARLLGLLVVIAPYVHAAQLAWQLLGVRISPMGIWNVAQRLGEAGSAIAPP